MAHVEDVKLLLCTETNAKTGSAIVSPSGPKSEIENPLILRTANDDQTSHVKHAPQPVFVFFAQISVWVLKAGGEGAQIEQFFASTAQT